MTGDARLINGIPGAGKTTVAHMLAQRFPRSAHVEGDVLHEFVASGRVIPGAEPLAESDLQLDLCARNLCLWATLSPTWALFPSSIT